jgi:hypothetical protein
MPAATSYGAPTVVFAAVDVALSAWSAPAGIDVDDCCRRLPVSSRYAPKPISPAMSAMPAASANGPTEKWLDRRVRPRPCVSAASKAPALA